MTPEQILGVLQIIQHVGTWPTVTVLIGVIIAPWIAVVFLVRSVTRAMTQLTDAIQSNQYCPFVRVDKRIDLPGQNQPQ